VIVGFNPATEPEKLAAFNAHYGVAGLNLIGPFDLGTMLNDSGGEVRLERPDEGPQVLPDNQKFTPVIPIDNVQYDDVFPWPTEADGEGQSLQRINLDGFGLDVANWRADDPTPGSVGSTPETGPRVEAVVVWNSNWSAAFKDAVAPPGSPVDGYHIPAGEDQLTALPWTGLNRISITFDTDVVVSSGALTLTGLNNPTYNVGANATYDPVTKTATWTMPNIIGDRLTLQLDDTKVAAAGSLLLDGEWNPGSGAFPSGNGAAGGDFTFSFNVLPGDADGDADVADDDFDDIRAAAFSRIGGPEYDTRYDINGSGAINAYDLVLVRNRRPSQLPPAPSPSAEAGSPARSPSITILSATRRAGVSAIDAAFTSDSVESTSSSEFRLAARARRR
jgi:hypothetical protein